MLILFFIIVCTSVHLYILCVSVISYYIISHYYIVSCSMCLPGQERFGNMTRVYYREAMGAFIVFDVTRPASFEAVTKWKEDLDSKLTLANGKHVATVLLANKCDQGRDVLTNNGIKMEQFCQENGFVGWYETSAKVRKMGHVHSHTHTYEYKSLKW